MSLILAVAFLSLALILYRLLFRAVRAADTPRLVRHWLIGDMLVCLMTGLLAFGLLYVAFTVGEVSTGAIGIGDSAIAAGIAALAWLALDRLSERRRARRAPGAPLAGGRAPAA